MENFKPDKKLNTLNKKKILLFHLSLFYLHLNKKKIICKKIEIKKIQILVIYVFDLCLKNSTGKLY